MNRVGEIISILLLSFFLLFFLAGYFSLPSVPLVSLQEVTWKHRTIESISQGVLILAVVIGIFSLERR